MKASVKTANKGALNLRAAPSSSAKILAQIPYGTELEVSTLSTEWVPVTYESGTGYVMSKFLSELQDSTATKASLKKVYDELSIALKMIEDILK